ncbi:MAG TPA: hypothetical protein VK116_06405 [Planctomycetota bacterium]|nr:hypothetical protein [Planctomycetota bacterium]
MSPSLLGELAPREIADSVVEHPQEQGSVNPLSDSRFLIEADINVAPELLEHVILVDRPNPGASHSMPHDDP